MSSGAHHWHSLRSSDKNSLGGLGHGNFLSPGTELRSRRHDCHTAAHPNVVRVGLAPRRKCRRATAIFVQQFSTRVGYGTGRTGRGLIAPKLGEWKGTVTLAKFTSTLLANNLDLKGIIMYCSYFRRPVAECRIRNFSFYIQTTDASQLNRVYQAAVSQACPASSGSFCSLPIFQDSGHGW